MKIHPCLSNIRRCLQAVLILIASISVSGLRAEDKADAKPKEVDPFINNPTQTSSKVNETTDTTKKATFDGKPLPSDEELKKILTPIQFAVTRQNGTERPFTNEFWQHKEDGIYVDIVSGVPLFSSKDKFDTHCGWPAFAKPINDEEIKQFLDTSHGMQRVEVRSSTADSHLGHVFNDGPKELGGLRYCINSASLRFVPKDKMKEAGYGELYTKLFAADDAKAATTAATTAAGKDKGKSEAK